MKHNQIIELVENYIPDIKQKAAISKGYYKNLAYVSFKFKDKREARETQTKLKCNDINVSLIRKNKTDDKITINEHNFKI